MKEVHDIWWSDGGLPAHSRDHQTIYPFVFQPNNVSLSFVSLCCSVCTRPVISSASSGGFPPFLLFTFRLNRSTAEVQFSDRCTSLELYLRGLPSALGTRIYLTLDRSSSFVARIRLNVSQTVKWNRVDGWMENRCRQWLPAFPLSTFDVPQFLNQEVSYPQSTKQQQPSVYLKREGIKESVLRKINGLIEQETN